MVTLGKYELHEKLGRGGFGTVYRAMDTSLGREVALKVLHPELTIDKEFVDRFRQEAKTLALLDDRNIVTIHEINEENGRIYIAMRYLPGGSLRNLIEEKGKVQFTEALRIITQVASGLSEAHKRGVIHRDIKPENIVFDSHDEAILTDFGLVRGESTETPMAVDNIMGTPSYIAPEIWDGEKATAASDEYALGCVFYEMITGQRLFDGKTIPEIMKKHFDKVSFSNTWSTDVPLEVKDIIGKAIEKDPKKRYGSVLEFVEVSARHLEVHKSINDPQNEGVAINVLEDGTQLLDPSQKPEGSETQDRCEDMKVKSEIKPPLKPAPVQKKQKNYNFEDGLTIQTTEISKSISGPYTVISKKLLVPLIIGIIILIIIGIALLSQSINNRTASTYSTQQENNKTIVQTSNMVDDENIYPLSAASINLLPSDLPSNFGLMSEEDNVSFQNAQDGNTRNFVNDSMSEYLTSNVFITKSVITDSLSDYFLEFEDNQRNSQPNVSFVFGEINPLSIGDKAGYVKYSLREVQWKGVILIFAKSNVLVILDYLTSSGDSSKNNLVSYSEIIAKLIDSPRIKETIPTITPISLPTILPSGNSFTKDNINFSNYTSPDGSFKVDLPVSGCMYSQIGITCDITSEKFGLLNVIDGAANGSMINDTNSLAVATNMLEALKPTGMLTTYSNISNQGNLNGMYAYCFNFDHQNLGDGFGCLGFETVNEKLFVIQFFTFNLGRDQIIWDTAHESFQINP